MLCYRNCAAATAVYCSNLLPTKDAAPISVAGYNTSEKNVDSLDDTEQTPTEVQKPGGTGDFAYETVAEGAASAKNNETAVPTKNNDKKGESAALGYDFKVFRIRQIRIKTARTIFPTL